MLLLLLCILPILWPRRPGRTLHRFFLPDAFHIISLLAKHDPVSITFHAGAYSRFTEKEDYPILIGLLYSAVDSSDASFFLFYLYIVYNVLCLYTVPVMVVTHVTPSSAFEMAPLGPLELVSMTDKHLVCFLLFLYRNKDRRMD